MEDAASPSERLHHEPDGNFPNGVPNPLLVENRAITADAVREQGADLGIAWDGDFDRCFLFDHNGRYIEGYYIVGLLAASILAREPGGRVVHDPRLTWNTIEVVKEAGGVPVQSRSGHAFMKEVMRQEGGIPVQEEFQLKPVWIALRLKNECQTNFDFI